MQINWKLFDWLDRYENARMIIIHENPEQMANNSRYLRFRTFERYRDRDKIDFIEKWFQDVEVGNVLDFNNG